MTNDITRNRTHTPNNKFMKPKHRSEIIDSKKQIICKKMRVRGNEIAKITENKRNIATLGYQKQSAGRYLEILGPRIDYLRVQTNLNQDR